MSSPAVRRVLAAVVAKQGRTVVATGMEVHAILSRITPVDTGFAASNWLASIGQPEERVVGARGAVDAQAAATSLAQAARAYHVDFGPLFIQNHVEYIRYLNDGSSSKEPAGFVERAIAEAVENVASRSDEP